MTGEGQRFPRGAFLPLTVGAQAKHPSRFALEPPSERHASGQRQPMAQAAGRKQNIRRPACRRVAAQFRAVAVEALEVIVGQLAG